MAIYESLARRALRKFMMGLGILTLTAAVLILRPQRSSADSSIQGDWHAKFLSSTECVCINLEVERSSWGHHSNWGDTHNISDFVGLDAGLATAKDYPVHFELRRDAGVMSFDGRFQNGEGSGKFTFAASADYVQGMKALGYAGLSQEQLFAFAMHDVSRQFVKDMNDLGYRSLATDGLVAFRIHGVSPEFTKEINSLPGKDFLSTTSWPSAFMASAPNL